MPNARDTRSAVVLGCGVIGITSAIELAAHGWNVRLLGRDRPARTTSAVAAAVWFPFRVAPVERTATWGRHSYTRFLEHAKDPDSGVRMLWGEVIGHREPDREVMAMLPDASWMATDAQRRPGTPSYRVRVPCVDMPRYLRWLERRLCSAGVEVELRAVSTLEEAAALAPVIVNCTGLGARALAQDEALFPIRGQVVRVRETVARAEFVIDDDNPHGLTYIVPRCDETILGGTADDGAWSTVPDSRAADEILARCREVEPALRAATTRGVMVGLRPGRHAVRLEAQQLARDCLCLHNYGHGGAGVTLSWGCAREVVRLAGASGTCVAPGEE